jgi:hypothetical protein
LAGGRRAQVSAGPAFSRQASAELAPETAKRRKAKLRDKMAIYIDSIDVLRPRVRCFCDMRIAKMILSSCQESERGRNYLMQPVWKNTTNKC